MVPAAIGTLSPSYFANGSIISLSWLRRLIS